MYRVSSLYLGITGTSIKNSIKKDIILEYIPYFVRPLSLRGGAFNR